MLDEMILKVLRDRAGGHVSGEEICKTADVSRAAVWKQIEKLRGDGYDIDASPHLGYRLLRIPDRLIPAEIRWGLKAKLVGREIISYRVLDSTNDAACSLAEKGAREGLVVIAEEQAKGRGRRGRRWISPLGSGIYLSCVLRPAMPPNVIPRITLLAAVAVCRSIRQVTGLEAMIKWPNDILVHGRKVCGILTEMKAEQDSVSFVVVGIGVNVNTPHKLLPKGAASLREEPGGRTAGAALSRVELARDMLEKLDEEYRTLREHGFEPIIEAWKGLTAMLGSRIRVVLSGRNFEGQAYDIDADGSLVVRLDSGIMEKVSSGDIVMVR